LKFGSWTFDESGVNLTTKDSLGQLDAYVQNGEWDLEGIGKRVFIIVINFRFCVAFVVARQAVVYECCPTVYPFVLFRIQIRRRTLYYVVNVVGKRKNLISNPFLSSFYCT
jgi:hypothetical protein